MPKTNLTVASYIVTVHHTGKFDSSLIGEKIGQRAWSVDGVERAEISAPLIEEPKPAIPVNVLFMDEVQQGHPNAMSALADDLKDTPYESARKTMNEQMRAAGVAWRVTKKGKVKPVNGA